MVLTRVIPALLLRGRGLVKTIKFKNPTYVGDPRNAVKIFNEKEVDELIILDISATVEPHKPQVELIHEIVTESFMPVAYGGGIRQFDDVKRIISLGVEKVVLCSYAVENPNFVKEVASSIGSSSTVVCLDVRKKLIGGYELHTHSGTKRSGLNPVSFARHMEEMGAGELVVNSIDRDGTMMGYDLDLLKAITSSVKIPVIALGGAGKLEDFRLAVSEAGVSAVAAGSLFVFQGKHRAVLISYPDSNALRETFNVEENSGSSR